MYARNLSLFLFGILIAAAVSALPLFVSAHSLDIPNENIATSTLISLANADREHHGLSPLHADAALEKAAQRKVEDMVAQSYFAHTSPLGTTPWGWLTRAGYSFHYAGENLAIYFSRSEDIEEAWMASPGHRANILSTNYSDIGIGYATGIYNDIETTYVVELFGAK